MVPEDIIRKILEYGVQAPSGENAQPWRFEVNENRISLFDIPERDPSVYNFRGRASHIAHGAVIQNIVIASREFGYAPFVELFPAEGNARLIARITLQNADKKEEPLFPFIKKRSTNRKAYRKEPVLPEVLEAVERAAAIETSRVVAGFISDAEKIKTIAHAVSLNDELLLEKKPLHDFFFSHINWTIEEEEKKRIGFYIKTLELPPPVEGLFRIFKYWRVMRLFNVLGAAKGGAKQNREVYASGQAMGMLVISKHAPEDFVTAGMVLQNIWLTATKHGLSFQPLTGVLFFNQRIEAGEPGVFSARDQENIKIAYQKIKSVFGVQDGIITMLFRMGYADAPSAHSLKQAPEIVSSKN